MDWARAIERNRDALSAILATLFAMLGLQAGAEIGRVSRSLHRAVLRVLRPAESAVRRLIVIAARGLVAKPAPVRPMPKGRVIARKGGGRVSFQLFDPRTRVALWYPKRIPDHLAPRIWSPFKDPHLIPLYQPEPGARRFPPKKDDSVDTQRLARRLLAIERALATLPQQAKRLVRWRMRRQAMPNTKFVSPLRTGRPPGHRDKSGHEVDFVLKECHALARELDTS